MQVSLFGRRSHRTHLKKRYLNDDCCKVWFKLSFPKVFVKVKDGLQMMRKLTWPVRPCELKMGKDSDKWTLVFIWFYNIRRHMKLLLWKIVKKNWGNLLTSLIIKKKSVDFGNIHVKMMNKSMSIYLGNLPINMITKKNLTNWVNFSKHLITEKKSVDFKILATNIITKINPDWKFPQKNDNKR